MANQQHNATITIGAAVSASVRKTIGIVTKGFGDIGKEIDGVVRKQRAMEKERANLVKQGQSVDALDREYRELGATLDRLRSKQAAIDLVQNRAVGAASALGGAFGTVARQARTAAFAVAGSGGLGFALFQIAKDTSDMGDAVAKQAQALGMSVVVLQELNYVAERSGVSTEALSTSLLTMTKNVGMAAKGSGRAKKALEALGISAQRLSKNTPEQQLEVLAQRLNQVENPTQRATYAMQIFGESGAAMTVMLGEGVEGMRGLRQEARDLGFVLSDKASADAEAFNDALLDVKLGAQGLKNTIGSALMPVFTDAMHQFTAWLKENRDPVQQFATDLAEGLRQSIPILGEVLKGLGTVIQKGSEFVVVFKDLVGGWENVGIAAATLFAAPSILAIGRVVWAVGGLGLAVVQLVGKIGGIGPAMAAAATTTEASVGRMNRSMGRLNLGAMAAAVQAFQHMSQAEVVKVPEHKDPAARSAWQDEQRKKLEARDKALEDRLRKVPGLGSLMGLYDSALGWRNEQAPARTAPFRSRGSAATGPAEIARKPAPGAAIETPAPRRPAARPPGAALAPAQSRAPMAPAAAGQAAPRAQLPTVEIKPIVVPPAPAPQVHVGQINVHAINPEDAKGISDDIMRRLRAEMDRANRAALHDAAEGPR